MAPQILISCFIIISILKTFLVQNSVLELEIVHYYFCNKLCLFHQEENFKSAPKGLNQLFISQKSNKIDESSKAMASKNIVVVNPLQPPVVDVEHIPLADTDFKITDTVT